MITKTEVATTETYLTRADAVMGVLRFINSHAATDTELFVNLFKVESGPHTVQLRAVTRKEPVK